MVYGYARVSTRGQAKDGNSLEAQEKALIEAGASYVYKDSYTGITKDRPELNKLLNVVEAGDKIVVTKLDRVARSAMQGMQLIDELLAKGITVHILNMGELNNTPTGKLIRTIFLAFAEFERDMIVDRTQEGKAIAKERAKQKGEKFVEGRPDKFSSMQINNALQLLDKHSYSEVVKLTGISKSTLIRAKRKADLAKMDK
mgnify:CR=1 FL=1